MQPPEMDGSPRILSYAKAIREAMALAMEADPAVILMGEDIGVYGGAFQVTLDLIDRLGPDRVVDTPISELGGAGVAVGAAIPYNPDLERLAVPQANTIEAAARRLIAREV